MSDIELHDILLIVNIAILAFFPLRSLFYAIKDRDIESIKWTLIISVFFVALFLLNMYTDYYSTKMLKWTIISTYFLLGTMPNIRTLERGIKGKNRGRIIKYSIIVAFESIALLLLFFFWVIG